MAKAKSNTERVSTETGWRLIADICHKADKNELLRKALKKLANLNQKKLLIFLGEVQTLFGRLKKVIPNITLEATECFNTRDFFKTKDEGGIFAHVDSDIFKWLPNEVKNSPAKDLASYEFTEDITEENIVGDAKIGEIYEEVDLAHIKQVCERHQRGESIFMMNKVTLFWIRDTKGDLCRVDVWLDEGGLHVHVDGFDSDYRWYAGNGSFFRN